MQSYRVVGVMSGTSLDGVDLALCHFTNENGRWQFEIKRAKTVPYNDDWKEKLSSLPGQDALTLARANVDYGK